MRLGYRTWGGWILTIGAVFVAVAMGLALKDHRAAAVSLPARGVVTALEPYGRGYRTVVRFDVNGRAVEIRSRQMHAAAALNDQVPVLYDPRRPDRAMIDDFGERHAPAAFFGFVGALLGLSGAAIVVLAPRLAAPARNGTSKPPA